MHSVLEILGGRSAVLAPMAGVAEAPFRGICKQMGAALTYSEMVSATGLHHNPHSPTATKLLEFAPNETPVAVQLFGRDPHIIAEQAARLLDRYGSDIALIDINMGCPVSKVVAKGEGSALMREPAQATRIVTAVVRASSVPVTVKFRKGWDDAHANAVEFARQMEDAGASGLAIHGRTTTQLYRGHADWKVIAQVKAAVSVPVFGSGDVMSADDVANMLVETGVDAVMIARGAQGNPWIFAEARALVERGERVPPPTPSERIDVARAHLRALTAFAGERGAVRMRKHIAWYVTGLPGATRIRTLVNECRSSAQLEALLVGYLDQLDHGERAES